MKDDHLSEYLFLSSIIALGALASGAIVIAILWLRIFTS